MSQYDEDGNRYYGDLCDLCGEVFTDCTCTPQRDRMYMKTSFELTAIDTDRLDQECARVPDDITVVGRELVSAQEDLINAEKKADLLESQIILSCVRDPKSHMLPPKPAMNVIIHVVRVNKKYQKRKEVVDKAQRRVSALKNLLNALDAKKRLLGDLVDLHTTDYYSDVRQPRTPESREHRQRAAAASAQQMLPRRKKCGSK